MLLDIVVREANFLSRDFIFHLAWYYVFKCFGIMVYWIKIFIPVLDLRDNVGAYFWHNTFIDDQNSNIQL